jgi:hypothetical protein
MGKVDVKMYEIATLQHQLVTRRQFLEFGSRQQLGRRLRSGALIRVYESVYRLPGVVPTWRQGLLAACFAGGRPSAAGFRAAAALSYLPGGEELVEVASPRWRRLQYPGVIAHESIFLEEKDLIVLDGIPTTRAARTIIDLASLAEFGLMPRETVELALLEAVRRNLVDIASVWREQERLNPNIRFGGRTMLDILKNFVPPLRSTESPGESRVLLTLRANDFPEPVPQYRITLPNGEHVRLDFAWPELLTSLEWDPYKYHGDRVAYERMMRRTRLMRQMGWGRVSLTDADFDRGMPETIAALRQIFAEKAVRL